MDNGDTRDRDFTRWLSRNKLDSYESALVAEGYEVLEALVSISDEEIEELTIAINAKPGHKRMLKIAVKKARKEKEEQEEQGRKEKSRREREEEREEAKREREEAKREREEVEQAELAQIMSEQKIAKARDQKLKADESSANRNAMKSAVGGTVKGTEANTKEDRPRCAPQLPTHKKWHFFASHKKLHSRNANASEMLARSTVDVLNTDSIRGFFDIDHLQHISMEALTENVLASCAVVLFLDDETHKSTWVIHEVQTARDNGVRIITVVDTDKYHQREVIEQYIQLGFGFLFHEQVIGFAAEYRKVFRQKLVEAIYNAVADYHKVAHPTKRKAAGSGRLLHGAASRTQDLTVEEQFIAGVSAYESVQEAWNTFGISSKGELSRSDFKRAIHKTLGIVCSDAERKQLRAKMDPQKTTRITFGAFTKFVDSTQGSQGGQEEVGGEDDGRLAVLPMDVPTLPDSFRSRINVEKQLKKYLLTGTKSSVIAQGMGGVGKSVLTAAVIRSEEIRARFDGIAWIGMNQSPNLLALQQRCYFQLIGGHMPKKSQHSVEEQHNCLSKALVLKKVLICIDDCWDKQHAKCFDAIDKSTASKLLISTRIAGLLRSSTEVQLALMTNEEAIDLLAHGAGLDFGELSASVVEVIQLCGRLPLCLNIASGIIADHGDNWEAEVLPGMRKGFLHLAASDGGDGKEELSVQNSIIVASLASIVGKNAERIKRLLVGSACFGEDQRVPVRLFVTLWSAIVKAAAQAKHKNAVKSHISITDAKKMIGVLVRRSLLMELVRGSVQLHDIVREYVLSKMEEERKSTGGLKLLQRACVSEFLASQEKWEAVEGAKIPRGKELDWYLCSGALGWHMKSAWSPPLIKDAAACSWLHHESSKVVICAVKAIPLQEQTTLAEELAAGGDLQQAAGVLANLLELRELPVMEVQIHSTRLFEFVDRIPMKTRSSKCIKYEASAAYVLMFCSELGSSKWEVAYDRLHHLANHGAELDHSAMAKVWAIKAFLGLGCFLSKPAPTALEFYEAGQVLRKGCTQFEIAITRGEIGPAEVVYRKYESCLFPYHRTAVDYWTVPLDQSERARTGVAALVQGAAAYDYERDHAYGMRMSAAKLDPTLEIAGPLCLLALWWCDERGTADYLSVWEDGQMRAIAEGDSPFQGYGYVFPVMRVIPALGCVWRVLGAAGMSWREAGLIDTAQNNHQQIRWSLPDGSASYCQPQYFNMVAKLECFLCGPDQVEASEALDYLPQADSCKWVRDRVDHIYSSAECLGTRMSKVALACGESFACIDLAATYAKAASVLHLSQQKVMHAQAALGLALMKHGRKDNSSTPERNEEAVALVNQAHESAQKMRLRRYVYYADITRESDQPGQKSGQ